MKFLRYMLIILLFLLLLSGCGNQNNKINSSGGNKNNAEISKTSITQNIDNNTDNNNNNDNNNENLKKEAPEPKETEISSFSTPLKSGGSNRLTNIKLTCNKINGLSLKNGETFSFNQIVGPCTAEEGYLKAEIYVNKKIKYALGGGNCQVSTTLYNTALAVPGINIVERHEHGRSVDYIQKGKDATVSYNTLDLKFTNNTEKELKLYTWCDDVNVYAKITQITYE